jgi:hypothetical protein
MNNYSNWYLFITFLLLVACNNASTNPDSDKTARDSLTEKAPVSAPDKTPRDSPYSEEKPSQTNSEIQINILGNWALVGTSATTFVIEKKEIFYPEASVSYAYKMAKDTLRIKYDDYEGIFLIRKPHADTLILTGGDVQVYYRFKK